MDSRRRRPVRNSPPVGDSVAEMASIPGGEPPTLDSRLRGNDGCAKVSLRGKDDVRAPTPVVPV